MPRGLPVQRLPEEVERPLEAAVRGVGAGGERRVSAEPLTKRGADDVSAQLR